MKIRLKVCTFYRETPGEKKSLQRKGEIVTVSCEYDQRRKGLEKVTLEAGRKKKRGRFFQHSKNKPIGMSNRSAHQRKFELMR